MSKIDRETASEDFERMAHARRLQVDPKRMNEEDAKKFGELKGRIVDAICDGFLAIDENGLPTMTLQEPVVVTDGRESKKYEFLTFQKPKGRALRATDGMSDLDSGKRLHAMMSTMAGCSPIVFDEMDWVTDHKLVQDLFSLFLG